MATTTEEPTSVDLSAERFAWAVPFETFAHLRRTAPVYWHAADQCWVLTTHEVVSSVNRRPERFSNSEGVGPQGQNMITQRASSFERGNNMLVLDPPEHTTYRRVASTSFSPSRVNKLEGMVREATREALAAFRDRGGGDFAVEVAARVPLRVIAELVGIPRQDEPEVLRLTNALIAGSDPEYVPADGPMEVFRKQVEYADQLVEEHRRQPRGDLIDDLLAARVDGAPLTPEDIREYVLLYINGGSETTRHLLTNGLLALLEWPQECARLRSGEASIATAMEELLRWASPVMHHSRWPTEPVELAGQWIKPGQRTTLWMIAANRDEAVFSEPDRLDLGRVPNPHVSLGAGGPHHCLGAYLARLEGRVVFEELLPLLGSLSLADEPQRLQHTMFNGIKHLKVKIGQ